MRLLIVGSLKGQLITAAKIAVSRGASVSQADTIEQVIAETRASTKSEREGRLIDSDGEASMERKKREGYF